MGGRTEKRPSPADRRPEVLLAQEFDSSAVLGYLSEQLCVEGVGVEPASPDRTGGVPVPHLCGDRQWHQTAHVLGDPTGAGNKDWSA